MTSLAQQLQRLAVPHTQSVLGKDKKRVSLLFDPSEAANLDRETVFALGSSGLEELETLDQLFDEFESTLFNPNSTDWERSMQTREVNEKLDATIERYLIAVSPYFLLKSAQKTLEWLLFRYHVHLYNKDILLLAFLPYHDSKIFVRLLQTLDLKKETDKWHWLLPSATNGVSLARSTLCNHCKKDPGFLAYACDLLPKFIKVHGPGSPKLRAMIGLYTCAMLGTLQVKEEISEKIVSVIMPRIVQGLKSACVDYTAATYMIVSQLAVQTNIKTDFLKTLIIVITKNNKPELTLEMLSCVALIYQTQEIDILPKKSFNHLCQLPNISQLLSSLSTRYNVSLFLRTFLFKLLPYAVSNDNLKISEDDSGQNERKAKKRKHVESEAESTLHCDLFANLIQVLNLPADVIHDLTREVVGALLTCGAEISTRSEERKTWAETAKKLLHVLQSKHGNMLDIAFEESLKSNRENDAMLAVLQQMTALTLVPARYAQVEKGQSLLLALNHANASTRQLGVRHLVTQLQQKQMKADDFVVSSLMGRLADDVPDVCSEVLKLDVTLCQIINKNQLFFAVSAILLERYTSRKQIEWHELALGCVNILGRLVALNDDSELAINVLGLLLPHAMVINTDARHQMQFAAAAMNAVFSSASLFDPEGMLSKSIQEWLDKCKAFDDRKGTVDLCALNELVFNMTAKWLHSPPAKQMTSTFMTLISKRIVDRQDNVLAFYQLSVCLAELQLTLCPDDVLRTAKRVLDIAKVIEINRKKAKGKDEATSDEESLSKEDIRMCLESLDHHSQVTPRFLFSCLALTLRKVAAIDGHGDEMHTKADCRAWLVAALELLMREACRKGAPHQARWQRLLASTVQDGLKAGYMLRLMPYIWMKKNVSALLRVGSYHLMANWIKTTDCDPELLLDDQSLMLAALLCALCHDQEAVRSASLSCMRALRRRVKEHTHAGLMKKLVKQDDEIQADPNQVVQILGLLYAGDCESGGEEQVSAHAAARKATLTYLLKFISDPECPSVMKRQLLRLISQVPHALVLDFVLPLGLELVEKVRSGETDEHTYSILEIIIYRLDGDSATGLTEDSQSWQFMKAAFTASHPTDTPTPSQITAIKQVDKTLFSALPSLNIQQQLITCLVDICVSSTCIKTVSACTHVLKHVRLQARHVQHELQPEEDAGATVKARKRTKQTGDNGLDIARAKVILEAIQAKSKSTKVKDTHEMTALLFSVLKSLLTKEHEDGEYCQQLVLSALHNNCSKWTTETKPTKQESLSVELLVQCVRSARATQTQQQALLVMATVAHLYPEYMLHHAMSIFTFMGDSLLQQDDAHTFQVITSTLNTLIPALVQAHGEDAQSPKLHALITDIIHVFVGARHHIPKHRRHVLFNTLMQTVGVDEYCWVLHVLIVESAVRNKDVPAILQDVPDDIMTKDMSAIDLDLEFACQISEKFSTTSQLHACVRIMRLLQTLTIINDDKRGGKVEKGKRMSELHPLKVATLTPQQLRLVEFHAARLVADLLSREAFVYSVLQEMEHDSDKLTLPFKEFVKECLAFLTKVARAFGGNSNTQSAKFWRALLGKVYDILDEVNQLLPTAILLDVISALMDHRQLTVRKKCLELLSTKLQQLDASALAPGEEQALLKVVSRLAAILSEAAPPGEADMMTQVKQLSLFCLRMLCKMLAFRQPQEFTKLFPPVIDLIAVESAGPVLGGALLCCGELCLSLKAHAISWMSKFMPGLLLIIANVALIKTSETLLICVLTSLQKILASLVNFLSPYLRQILIAVCSLSTLVSSDVDVDTANKNHPAVRLRNVKNHLCTDLAPRILLPIVIDTYAQLLSTQPVGVSCLLQILKGHIEHIAQEDLMAHNTALTNIFLRLLDVRNERPMDEVTMTIENECISALLSMVVRFSEMSFRPLYYKLYNWACGDDSKQGNIRKLTFFSLSTSLSERLKSLFNLFVGHCIKTACRLLEENNSASKAVDFYDGDEEKSCELLSHILAMMQSCFVHDSEGFISMDIFNTLLKPLVNQVENPIGGELVFETRISERVIPAIAQLAVAARDDGSCKALNYQICLKTRHVSPKVRFAALGCVEQLAQKLGEEYMTILPETIPFLAELMEDESEEVEQQCQQVVTSLEQLLGESLQNYF